MGTMTVNYNNLRKQAIFSYEKLVEKLNGSIIKESQFAEPNDEGHTNIKGYVLINAKDIQKDIDGLRRMIGAIAMVSMEGQDDFKDVYQEVFPKEDQSMKTFNDDDEENE